MEFKVDQNVKSLDGKDMTSEEGMPVTFRTVIINALMGTPPGATGEEKLLRFLLAERVQKPGATELSVDEAALIKKCVGEAFAPIVVGRIWSALDGSGGGDG